MEIAPGKGQARAGREAVPPGRAMVLAEDHVRSQRIMGEAWQPGDLLPDELGQRRRQGEMVGGDVDSECWVGVMFHGKWGRRPGAKALLDLSWLKGAARGGTSREEARSITVAVLVDGPY